MCDPPISFDEERRWGCDLSRLGGDVAGLRGAADGVEKGGPSLFRGAYLWSSSGLGCAGVSEPGPHLLREGHG